MTSNDFYFNLKAIEKSDVECLFQFLKDKLANLTYTHELLVKQSNDVAKVLNKLENINSTDKIVIKKLNQQSSSCKIAISDHVNCCENFIDVAYKLYMSMFLSKDRLHLLETDKPAFQKYSFITKKYKYI